MLQENIKLLFLRNDQSSGRVLFCEEANTVTTQLSSRKSAAIERSNAKFNANNFSIIKFMASALDFSASPRNDD